jgi:hypothetical protein
LRVRQAPHEVLERGIGRIDLDVERLVIGAHRCPFVADFGVQMLHRLVDQHVVEHAAEAIRQFVRRIERAPVDELVAAFATVVGRLLRRIAKARREPFNHCDTLQAAGKGRQPAVVELERLAWWMGEDLDRRIHERVLKVAVVRFVHRVRAGPRIRV